MGDRNLDNGRNFSKGLVYLDCSFLTNGAADPVASSFRGTPLGDVVKSITYSATGKYTVVLKDKWRYLVTKYPDLEDLAVPDGAYATIGNISGEGGGALTFVLTTFTAGGVATQYTGRRVSFTLCLKNSTVGV